MTVPNDPGLLLRAVDVLAGQRTEVAADFYRRLFERYPHLQSYFNGTDTAGLERMFVTALRSMMMAASSPPEFERAAVQLAERHVPYAVKPDHFQLFVEVLLETLADYGGDAWTPEVEAAWRAVATQTANALSAGSAPAE